MSKDMRGLKSSAYIAELLKGTSMMGERKLHGLEFASCLYETASPTMRSAWQLGSAKTFKRNFASISFTGKVRHFNLSMHRPSILQITSQSAG